MATSRNVGLFLRLFDCKAATHYNQKKSKVTKKRYKTINYVVHVMVLLCSRIVKSVSFCQESRVEGKMSRVEGKMSWVQKCPLHSGFESLVKKLEFLGRFCIIEQFTFLYTVEYFHAVSSIPKISRHRSEEVYNAVDSNRIGSLAASSSVSCSIFS